MDVNTIVLVLVSLCGGAALVLIASAYRELQNKVNVSVYELEQTQREQDLNIRFENLERDLFNDSYFKHV